MYIDKMHFLRCRHEQRRHLEYIILRDKSGNCARLFIAYPISDCISKMYQLVSVSRINVFEIPMAI